MAMIDLRSDTVTKPTPAMRRAMMEAEVGDDGRLDPQGMGEDPTMNRLEALAAALLGKDRALFVPSGTMGNVVAAVALAHLEWLPLIAISGDLEPSRVGSFTHQWLDLVNLFKPWKIHVPAVDLPVPWNRQGPHPMRLN